MELHVLEHPLATPQMKANVWIGDFSGRKQNTQQEDKT
jgi:hypothetical protein